VIAGQLVSCGMSGTAMRIVIPVSIAFGIAWNVAAMCLLGGRVVDAFAPGLLVGGAIAGMVAGAFTIWSRRRAGGHERVRDVIAHYFITAVAYWIGFVVTERIIMCVQHGGWTDFDLHDHLSFVLMLVVYHGIQSSLVLVPFSALSRFVIWKTYTRSSALRD
jgi:hypothetical protein